MDTQMTAVYRKKLSREGKILILKDRLRIFPSVGRYFNLRVGKDVVQAKVSATRCICMGPDKPHEHYYLTSPGLGKHLEGRLGQVAVIKRDVETGYSLAFERM